MQKAVQLGISLAFIANAVAIFGALTPLQAKGEEVLSPAAQRGLVIVRANCSRCHAVGKIGDSPLPIAPPFRTLHERYPAEDLQEPLAEGIVTGHPTMPEFRPSWPRSPRSGCLATDHSHRGPGRSSRSLPLRHPELSYCRHTPSQVWRALF